MAAYLPRLIDSVLERRIQHHPTILVVGPRATGKTTTAARQAQTIVRLNTAGLVDRRTLYTSAGRAKATGEAYEQLLRNLLVVDAIPAWWIGSSDSSVHRNGMS